jgi:hypothetical protein
LHLLVKKVQLQLVLAKRLRLALAYGHDTKLPVHSGVGIFLACPASRSGWCVGGETPVQCVARGEPQIGPFVKKLHWL